MPRHCEEPLESAGPYDRRVFNHPAFGQITVHRISGHRALYGSDFEHSGFVRVAIHESELNRDLSRDWHFAKREIVAIDMSEAQWAAFVSSFNQGSGVPCTIAHREGRAIPEFPLRDEGQEYKVEADAKLSASIESLKKTIKIVEENTVGLTKAKAAAILAPLQKTLQELQANLPFVAQSFGEHMETRVEKAKVEVNAYMTNTLARAGLEHLQAQAPLQITQAREKDAAA
jgi:hypothetical protein